MQAERVVDLVCKKLFEFGIDLNKYIVATVNDGASVMVKYGRLIEAEQQLCYAHGIHWAVCDFLYSKGPNCSEGMYFNEDDYFTDAEIQDNDTMTELNGEIDDIITTPLLKKWIEDVISKVRRIVRLFRRSPVKNSILHKYVDEEKGRELSLLLDCKTRWNSLIAMIERFILPKSLLVKH